MLNIVKNTIISNLLDLIIPHSCRGCDHVGSVLCECCKNYIIKNHINICPNCKNPTKNGKCQKCKNLPPIYSVGIREGLLDNLIHDFKYNSTRALGPKLAELLDASLPKNLKNITIVPLPTATNHIRARGLDHTLSLTKHLAKIREYQVAKILVRNQNTVQVGTDRKTRLSQADSAYEINKNIVINSTTTYLLLDDVWTTGASMQTAIKKLRESGAKNIIVVLLAISK